MKRCHRCHSSQLNLVRESVTRRGAREYEVAWYRCPSCHDVSLLYRRSYAREGGRPGADESLTELEASLTRA